MLLVWLVLACIVPGGIGAVLLFLHSYGEARSELEQDTIQTVRALAQALDSRLSKAQAGAQALATSGYLEAGDLAAFDRQARAVLQSAGLGSNIVLSDRSGQQLINTLRKPGEPLPRHGNPELLQRVFATGQPAMSNLYAGGVTGRPVMSIDVPVRVGGQVVYDLSVGLLPEDLGQILDSQRMPADWVAAVFDRTGTIGARTHLAYEFVGQKIIPGVIERMGEAPEGVIEAATREGIPSLVFYRRSLVSNWGVGLAIPRQSLEARVMRTASLLGLGVGLFFLVGIGLAWFAGARIARSVRALKAPAMALGAGEAVQLPMVYLREADEVAQAMGTAARELARRETALNEAHELLREREAELAKAQGIAHLGSWYWDLRDDSLTVSDELRRIFGRLAIPSFAEQLETLYPRDAWRQLDAAVRHAMRSGAGFELELPAIRGDGAGLWLHLRCEAIREPDGQVVGLRGTTQDITARKEAEFALAEARRTYERQLEQQVSERTRKLAMSEDRFRILFEGAPVGQLLMDPDSLQILVCNQAAADIHGCSREELCRMTVADLGASLSADVIRSIQRRVQTGEQVSFETPMLRKDGELRDLLVTVLMLPTAEGNRFHATHMDVTERKRAEREQFRLNRTLRLLSDCNIALVRAEDESQLLGDLCRLVVNSGGYLMCWVGVPERDAEKSVRPVARSGHEQGYLDRVRVSWDGERELGLGPTGTAIRTGFAQVHQNCLADPALAPWREAIRQRGFASVAALPLSSGGQILGALTLYSSDPQAFDAEEMRTLEELADNVAYGLDALRARRELERHQEQLEQLVSDRTRKIAALNVELVARAKEAESANVAKSTFLATMSHELRTPLTAVVGLTGLLAESPLDRQQRDYAEKIQSSATTLRGLIDNILDFSKIEAGALRLEEAPFSLNGILRQVATTLSIGTRGKPVEPLLDVAGDVPDDLVGDALRLQQILLNLASNAAKFTAAGGIVVQVRCAARSADGATLEFAVRDTGIGIPAAKREAIFDVFSQADSSISRRYGGSGLGLAISARLATLMGGSIQLESEEGCGSEFRLTVPLTLAPAKAAPPIIEALGGLRVLIADDHPAARAILARTCANLGWAAVVVDSGTAALEELRRSAAEGRDYDVLLLDWHMPGLNGIETLRRAYVTPGVALPLVVMMAATFELEQAVAAADDLHLDGLVAKPVTPASLLDAVGRAHLGEPAELARSPGRLSRRLAGLRLLVAEDNEMNQQVVQLLLTRAGARVDIAADGLAAVEALRDHGDRYDVVLMDIQMPVMDGYEATRIIREELGLLDLPIIAVTAYARLEDREKSRRAGMAGHVTKPIDVEQLLEILGRLRGDVPEAAEPPAVPAAAGPLDFPGLDAAAALQAFGGDRRQYGDLLHQLAARSGEDMAKACRSLAAGDAAGAARVVHDLSGIASFLRATEVARLAAACEGALLAGEAESAQLLLDELQVALDALGETIAHFDRLIATA